MIIYYGWKRKVKENMENNKIEVIFVEPNKEASVIEIHRDLESMQRLVQGHIEEYMPFEDEVAIVCNEEGKMLGLDLNRGIKGENGDLQDIICGNFFICYAPIESEEFLSMPQDLKIKYLQMFKQPEVFFKKGDKIFSEKVDAKVNILER